MLLVSTLFSSFAFANEQSKPSLVALGDSITYGYGLGSPVSEAFPHLIGGGKLDVTNLGVPGWTSGDLLSSLQTDSSVIQALQSANVITLNIGSNDLLQAANFAGLIEDPTLFDPVALGQNVAAAIGSFGNNLIGIISTIRQHSQAPIILYTIYNPIPLENPLGPTFYGFAEQMISKTNNEVIKPTAIGSKSLLADAYVSYTDQQLNYLLPNDVHPNQEGHQVLANLANQLLIQLLVPSNIELTVSHEEQSTDPVSISVTTTGQVIEMKWLPGEKEVSDFLEEGNVIIDREFEVTENGTYTVYVKNVFGFETVNSITINNILEEPPIEEEPPAEEEPPVEEEPPAEEEPPVEEEPPAEEEKPVVKKPEEKQKKDKKKEKGKDKEKENDTIVPADKKNKLPNTATPMYNYMGIGIGLILLGSVLLFVQRLRRIHPV